MTPQPTHPARADVVLDVDGVLSPICDGNPASRHAGWWPTAHHHRPAGLPCWVSPDLVARVNAIAARPGVAMYWLTSWREDAPTWFAPTVGLHATRWPVLDAADTETLRQDWWKADALTAHLSATDATLVVWVDDDIDDWAGEHPGTPALLTDPRLRTVRPRLEVGLTPAHLDRIDALLDAHLLPATPPRDTSLPTAS